MKGKTVIVIGGRGMLGQHLIRELHLQDDIAQIRVLDKKPFQNHLDYEERVPVQHFTVNISQISSLTDDIFESAQVVFFCATWEPWSDPYDDQSLMKTHVEGTKNILAKCIVLNITRFIFNSSNVAYVKSYNGLYFSLHINASETQMNNYRGLPVFRRYAHAVITTEQMILAANGTKLRDGVSLKTLALRHTPMYGAADTGLIIQLFQKFNWWGDTLVRIAGIGNKYQFTYAGNAAWANIRANKILQQSFKQIAGLPVNITDDTPVMDTLNFVCKLINSGLTTDGELGSYDNHHENIFKTDLNSYDNHQDLRQHFEDYYILPHLSQDLTDSANISIEKSLEMNGNEYVQRISTRNSDNTLRNVRSHGMVEKKGKHTTEDERQRKYRVVPLRIPTLLMYIIFLSIEFFVSFLNKWFPKQTLQPPLVLLNTLNSIVFFNGLRAQLHLEYMPKYNFEQSLINSGCYYGKLVNNKNKYNKQKFWLLKVKKDWVDFFKST